MCRWWWWQYASLVWECVPVLAKVEVAGSVHSCETGVRIFYFLFFFTPAVSESVSNYINMSEVSEYMFY